MFASAQLISDPTDLELLLVCAEPSIAEMYRLKFEMDGYDVTAVPRVRDWEPRRRGWRPDLVVLGLDLANESSIFELTRLRSDRVLGSVPLLVLSDRTTSDLAQTGVALRPTEYLLRIAVPTATPAKTLMS